MNKKLITKKNIVLTLLLVSLLILSSFIYLNLNRGSENKLFYLDEKAFVRTNKDYYFERMAFDSKKLPSEVYMGQYRPSSYFLDKQFKVINSISSLPVVYNSQNISLSLEKYSNKEYKIFFNQPVLRKDTLIENISLTNKNEIINYVNTKIDYSHEYKEFENFLSTEDQKANNFLGSKGGSFVLKCGEIEVINLSSSWGGILSKDNSIKDTTLTSSVAQNCDEAKNFKVVIPSIEQLRKVLERKDNVIYDPTKFPIDSYSEDGPNISDLRLNQDSKITINNFDVEYVYIEATGSLVPLLSLDGKINTSAGDKSIKFWKWILE